MTSDKGSLDLAIEALRLVKTGHDPIWITNVLNSAARAVTGVPTGNTGSNQEDDVQHGERFR